MNGHRNDTTRTASEPSEAEGAAGSTASRVQILERRDVREAVIVELSLVTGFVLLSAVLLGRESPLFVSICIAALGALALIALAWRRGASRHPHPSAFAITVVVMIMGTAGMLTAPLIAETMVGLFAVGVVGCALFMPWRARWHVAFLAMAAASYVPAMLVAAPITEPQRISALLVGLASVLTSGAGNQLTLRRRQRRWAVELTLRTQRVELRRTVARLQAAQNRIARLEGILPICAHCKRIRDGQLWRPVEQYVASRSDAQFSHGICPDCLRTHYPDYADEVS